jgi:rRNA methylases
MEQSSHYEFKTENHNLDIVIVCDELVSPANIGGVLRLSDAFGVKEVVFLGGGQLLTSRAKSVSRGTEKFVKYRFLENFEFDTRDWFCLELTRSSAPITSLSLKSNKIGIIIGNENRGVQNRFLELFPSFHIKMFGVNSSMNVNSALSSALFQLTNNCAINRI